MASPIRARRPVRAARWRETQPWTRHVYQYPTTLEQFSCVTVIWAAAALGAALGDILPGESKGQDLVELVGELGDCSASDTSSDDTN